MPSSKLVPLELTDDERRTLNAWKSYTFAVVQNWIICAARRYKYRCLQSTIFGRY